MKTLYCNLFLSLGLALCAGCGDNSTQSWENGKPKSSAGTSGSKPADVADNDAAGEQSDNPHGTVSPPPLPSYRGPAKTIAAHADEIKGFIRSMKVDAGS